VATSATGEPWFGCGGDTRVVPDAGTDDASNVGSSSGVDDVEIPDAFPTSCAAVVFTLAPDAAPNTCAFTPADVACDANADCAPYRVIGGGRIDLVYGVNKTSTVRCFAPPCLPIQQGCEGGSGYEPQDAVAL
jgi:hypothetical protein